MATTHKLSSAVWAQGWIGAQIEAMLQKASENAEKDPNTLKLMTEMQEMWTVVDVTMDELIKENQDMETRLSAIKLYA